MLKVRVQQENSKDADVAEKDGNYYFYYVDIWQELKDMCNHFTTCITGGIL